MELEAAFEAAFEADVVKIERQHKALIGSDILTCIRSSWPTCGGAKPWAGTTLTQNPAVYTTSPCDCWGVEVDSELCIRL